MKDLLKSAKESTQKLLEILGTSGDIAVEDIETEGRKYIEIKVTNVADGARLIGHHGKNVEAIAALVAVILPASEERVSVLLDINGYKEERNVYITDMTNKAIEQVVTTGQPVELAPMNPSERRVVHVTAALNEQVSTESVGEGEDRT
jgi:spoIIIJ-associated protein